jgi:hypothetical protein
VTVRERGGNSVPAFSIWKAKLLHSFARAAKETVVHVTKRHHGITYERFEIKRINHQEAYSLDGPCTNMAEGYFPRLRRAEITHIAGSHLLQYAQESSCREDSRRVSNSDQVDRLATPVWKPKHGLRTKAPEVATHYRAVGAGVPEIQVGLTLACDGVAAVTSEDYCEHSLNRFGWHVGNHSRLVFLCREFLNFYLLGYGADRIAHLGDCCFQLF